MEKLKQKVAILQESIETSKVRLDKSKGEVEIRLIKIEELKEGIESQKLEVNTVENDLDTAEEELIALKNERKKFTDEEEEIDRHLRKILRSKDQSQVGATGLQVKIENNRDKLAALQAEIADKENSINMYEQDLDQAEENNNMLKDQLSELNIELAEATAIHQSISSSRMTITGAGGNLRNQVLQRTNALATRKTEHENIQEQVDQLLETRDNFELDIDAANIKLTEARNECAQLVEELETI